MATREIRFGLIGGGLMGKEFASAASRWCHLMNLDFAPRIVAICSITLVDLEWFQCSVNGLELATTDYRELLARPDIEAIYCAVPHDLHAQIYTDVLRAGKHLLGEKPFGIDREANRTILEEAGRHPELLVRCSSEFPFWPASYRISQWIEERRFGQIIEVEAGFWHSSDLDPNKPANWKRRIATNGEYGCMGDLGMHVVHLPLRHGWRPSDVSALLSKIVTQRPDKAGSMVPCETWDNAILACRAEVGNQPRVPMLLSMKRIAPGHGNTWFVRIQGTELSAEFTTKQPKQLAYMPYTPGGEQSWRFMDLPHQPPYRSITGSIFEFGFSDGLLQMFAAFCDELANGDAMRQPFRCATPHETAESHAIFTAALESERTGCTASVTYDPPWP